MTERKGRVVGQWQPTSIDGVLRREGVVHADERGGFSELWRASWTSDLAAADFVQANLSRSRADVLRGLHFHRRQADLWAVVEGRAFVGLVDLRAGDLPLPAELIELPAGDSLYIPPLVAHGFYAPEQLLLVYLVTNEFDGSDEHGIAWDDPEVGIDWPVQTPILSERDRSNPALQAVLSSLRAEHR